MRTAFGLAARLMLAVLLFPVLLAYIVMEAALGHQKLTY